MSGLGAEQTVVLVHGWPGLPSDYAAVIEALGDARVIVPELAGFGAGYRDDAGAFDASADAYAARLLDELDRIGVRSGVVAAGYDIGSRIVQAALRQDPTRFDGAVLTPAYPGIGDRAAEPSLAPVFWYQHFHREPLAAQLIDGDTAAVHSYLSHIWTRWKGADAPAEPPHFDEVVEAYSRPGAFAASIRWYSANRGYGSAVAPIRTPVMMLWPTGDPLFPIEWADRLDQYFTNSTLRPVEDCGHFVPIEQPAALVDALLTHSRST